MEIVATRNWQLITRDSEFCRQKLKEVKAQ